MTDMIVDGIGKRGLFAQLAYLEGQTVPNHAGLETERCYTLL